ncbi:MAG: hypothetical protein LJF15_01205 [Acidobacteria bacterium]|jgi:hypothetical protein|nr:hypothetical protein [Acidobacteriota bacterium]
MTRRAGRSALAFLVGFGLAVAGGRAEAAGMRAPLVVAQLPMEPAPGSEPLAGGTLRTESSDGGRIVLVSPGGGTRVLTADFDSAADPDVSFDGRRIVFAARKDAGDPWCVWEMGADGTGARKVTCGPGGARRPVYLPMMYTLTPTSTEPWEQVAFVGTLPGETNEAGVGPRTALFACRLDGTRERQITFNLSSDFDPVVLPDGRMVFASWQRRSLDRGPAGRVALFGVNIDGTDLMLFAGDEGRRVKHMPAYAGDRLVVFVEGDTVGADGGGSLGSVSLRRNLHSYRSLTRPADGFFRSPATHPGGGVLVGWRPAAGEGSYGISRFDPATGRRTEVFDDPNRHDVQAAVLAPRPVPDGRSSSVRGSEAIGWFYGLDVGISDLDRSVWPPGTAKRVRLIEGLPRQAGDAEGSTGLAPRRLLGEVDLAGDGSFQVEVPADTPVELQLLDEDGLALRSCAWIWTRWREARGCIGCHEDPERTPPNRFVEAVQRPAARLTLPPDRRRFVVFHRDVWPIVERRCLGCHGSEGTSPQLDTDPARSYRTLLDGPVTPGKARTSPFIWHLLGRRTIRPWDEPNRVDAAATAKPIPPEGRTPTKEEIMTFIQWIDLGALWDRPMTTERATVRKASGGER